MLAMTRGASMKPACEATRRRAPSDRIVTRAKPLPDAAEAAEQGVRQGRVQGPSLFGADPREEIADEEAGRGYRERDREVRHGLLAVVDPRLAHDLHAVRYGFDSGVRAAAERVGAEEDDRQREKADALEVRAQAASDASRNLGRDPRLAREAVDEDDDVGDDEDHEDGHEDGDGLFGAADIEDDHEDDQDGGHPDLERLPRGREIAEHGVGAGDDRDRDGQDIVDYERASRDQAGRPAEGLRRDDVAAAAVREMLDYLRVGIGDHENREGRG